MSKPKISSAFRRRLSMFNFLNVKSKLHLSQKRAHPQAVAQPAKCGLVLELPPPPPSPSPSHTLSAKTSYHLVLNPPADNKKLSMLQWDAWDRHSKPRDWKLQITVTWMFCVLGTCYLLSLESLSMRRVFNVPLFPSAAQNLQ